ncbi:uncharacterized protein LOC141613048 [Silene latifolia]|uniref:uncharacterized protein LOC141613048 n=1 Tax=Silene latifolia TaxID=37657 RepID=UPI003D775A01
MAKKIRNLSNLERAKIIQILLLKCINGKPVRGTMLEVAQQYGVTRKAITNLRNEAKQQRDARELINVNSKLKGREGTNKVIFDTAKFKSIHYKLRTTQKRVVAAMAVSQSTVCRWVKSKVIRSHTNAIKPSLTDKNKLARLIFGLSKLYYDDMLSKIMFKDQSNVIHIDEKWFYITKDGGIWPFVSLEPAQRNSKNRVAGTIETKPIDSITKQVVKNMMLGVVLPEIKRKWSANASKTIFIQQDNARPHISNTDPDFREATSSDGAIQSLQTLTNSYKVDELVVAVKTAFDNLEVIKLNYVFITLQGCMIEVLKRRGHNDYKISHMHKSKLAKEGLLPEYLEAEKSLVKDSIRYINNVDSVDVANAGNAENITDLVDAVMSDSPYFIDMCS